MTVPAILSCQDCFSCDQPAQKKPMHAAPPENPAASPRTNATLKSTGRPSRRTTLRLQTMPPMVVPFHVHMPT